MGNDIADVLKRAVGWFTAPFTTPLDAVHIFLLVGIVLVSAALWSRVLAHMPQE